MTTIRSRTPVAAVALTLAALLATVSPNMLQAQPRNLGLEDFLPHGGTWQTASGASVSTDDPTQLDLEQGTGLIANGPAGKTTNLLTRESFADLEVHVEFMIPENSNSGVYLMGRYEIQIRDSFGRDKPRFADLGGVYQQWEPTSEPAGRGWGGVPPRVNAARAPGEWQTLDIVFRAPRFDQGGNKVEDAVFVQVVLNGVVVQQNVPVTGPTRASTFQDEQPRGPLMLQGDHGPVAYRAVRLRSLDLDHTGSVLGQWQLLDLQKDFDIVLAHTPQAAPGEVIQVQGGEVHCLYNWPDGQEAPSGLLVSKKRFSHYDLEFEIRHGARQFPPDADQPKNAGFMYHIQATTPIWPPCLEMQGRETRRGDHFSIRGPNGQHLQADGTIVDIPDREFSFAGRWSEPEHPGWNTMRIEVRGENARYFLNGVQVNEIRQASYGGLPCTSGFIAFQAEYSEVSYRNIRIRPHAPY